MKPFLLERFFEQYEFVTKYLLCSSDCESLTIQQLMEEMPISKISTKQFMESSLGYTEPNGNEQLRSIIAEEIYNQQLRSNQILIHVGGVEPMLCFAKSCLEPNDHVIVQWPSYQALFQSIFDQQCVVHFWKLKQNEQTGEFYFCCKELEELLEKFPIKAVVMNFPHNPSGAQLKRTEYETLLQLFEKKNIILFSDEVYHYLETSEEYKLPSACLLYNNAISLNVLAKSFGLAGLRIGWLASQNTSLLEKCCQYKDFTTICSPLPTQLLAIQAIANRSTIVSRNRNLLEQNSKLARDFFASHVQYFAFTVPKAGPITMVRVKPSFLKLLNCSSVEEVVQKLVTTVGVLLLPCSVYEDERWNDYVRLGMGRISFSEALQVLQKYIRECETATVVASQSNGSSLESSLLHE